MFEHPIYGLIVFCMLLLSPQAMAGKPDFPAPPKASVEWVGKNVDVNGIKSAIRAFHTKRSIESVVHFYRKIWKRPVGKDLPGYMESIDAAPWYVISRIEDDYLLSVQVRVKDNDQSGSWGYLSMSPLPKSSKKEPKLAKAVPRIPGTYILNEMKSKDPGKDASTVLLSNQHSVRNNADYYRSHYQSKGWTTETDQGLGYDEGHSLVFKNRRNRVTIMLLKDQFYTRIVVNSVKHSMF